MREEWCRLGFVFRKQGLRDGEQLFIVRLVQLVQLLSHSASTHHIPVAVDHSVEPVLNKISAQLSERLQPESPIQVAWAIVGEGYRLM